MPSSIPLMVPVFFLLFVLFGGALAQLSTTYYSSTCPPLNSLVRAAVAQSMLRDPRTGPKLLRLHFADCFVNGCDASVLLDNGGGILSERDTLPNQGITGMNIVDEIKTAVEFACPGVVSCADILALSSQIAVNLAGFTPWAVRLGRRDSRTANRAGAITGIPLPTYTPDQIISLFSAVGLDTDDVVALSGAHTFGKARCRSFADRLYNFNGTGLPDPDLNSTYAGMLRVACPQGQNLDNLVSLDPTTPNLFDSAYYSNLLRHRGLLQSDQDLLKLDATANLVRTIANDPSQFNNRFIASMQKMGDISPLTGTHGEIRANCHFIN